MYDNDLRLKPPPEGMTRVLAFTLATAMAWLGHVCHGECPAQAETLKVGVWFAEQAATTADDGINVVVIAGFGSELRAGTSVVEKGLVEQVNHCVQRDHIRVYERSAATWDDGLAVLCGGAESRWPLPARLR